MLIQAPNDEPAPILLERIRAEKEELIKQGKIKRDKKESVIFRGDDNSYYEQFADGKIYDIDDEIQYNIPDTWEFVRLSAITIKEIMRGKTPKYAGHSEIKVFAQKCNLKKGGINLELSQFLNKYIYIHLKFIGIWESLCQNKKEFLCVVLISLVTNLLHELRRLLHTLCY